MDDNKLENIIHEVDKLIRGGEQPEFTPICHITGLFPPKFGNLFMKGIIPYEAKAS